MRKPTNPSDIRWANFGIPRKTKIIWRIISYLLAILMIMIGFFIVLLVTVYNIDEKDDNSILFPLFITTMITVINILLKFMLVYTS